MEKKLRVASDELREKTSAPLRLRVSSSPFHSSFGHSNFGFDSSGGADASGAYSPITARSHPRLRFRISNFGTRGLRPNFRGVPPAPDEAESVLNFAEYRPQPSGLRPPTRNAQLATRNSPRGLRPNFRGVPPAPVRAAFTFIEVLFAVIILGIGFIMIAGVFPVAIQQTAVVTSETQGSLITRDAIRKIQNAADTPGANTLFPTTGTSAAPAIYAITTIAPAPGQPILGLATPPTGLLPALGADSLYSADKRFGWVGFYRRDSTTAAAGPPVGPYANIYVVALQNPNFPNYLYPVPASGQTTISASVPPPVPPSTYGQSPPQAAAIAAQFFYNSDGTTTAILTYNTSANPPQQPNGTTGAYVLVGSAPAAQANMVGRFFRLGNAAPSTVLPTGYNLPTGNVINQIFTVQSGSDITPADAAAQTPPWTTTAGTSAAGFTANIFCIGAAPAPDNAGEFTGPFTGPNQDIGVASAFIRVNTANN
jgi:hypothetical protein